MEDMYVKPGVVNETVPSSKELLCVAECNQERGWNDPPQFSYGLQMARGPPRTALNKRAVTALSSGAEASPTAPSPSRPMAPPMCGIAPPPLPAGPPPAGLATPPIHGGPMRSQSEADSSQSEPNIEVVMSVLNRALDACRHSVKVQVCNEVAKRLRLLEDSWTSGKLSLPVTRRMETLSQALQSGRWDSADELHRSLMVDHVTEVSQWMVGVKRLIAETRNLSPEHLKPLQSSAEPVQESPGGVEDSVDPDQDTEAEQGPEEMDLHPVEPVQDLVSQS